MAVWAIAVLYWIKSQQKRDKNFYVETRSLKITSKIEAVVAAKLENHNLSHYYIILKGVPYKITLATEMSTLETTCFVADGFFGMLH